MQIYAACLASYNNGRLHGRWIDAALGADHMRDEIAAMLRESPYPNVHVECPDCGGMGHKSTGYKEQRARCGACNGKGTVPSAEEYAIHDYDGIPSSWGEHPDIDKLAAYCEAMDELSSEEEREGFALWAEEHGDKAGDVDAFRDAYNGCWPSFRDYAENLAEEIGAVNPDATWPNNCIDWERAARELAMDYTTHGGTHGVHVFRD